MQKKKNGLENLLLVTQLGLSVVTPVFLCILAGIWIDRTFEIRTILIFLILGVVSGGLSAYRMARRTIDREKNELEKEKEEQIKTWNKRYGADKSLDAGGQDGGGSKGGGR